MARIIRIVETSNTGLPSSYAKRGFARKCLRVVECEPGQKGYKSERGVIVLWESDHYDSRSHGPKSNYAAYKAEAERIAADAERALAVGLAANTPAGIVNDLHEEQGL